jgi:RHS repeat-associated protein
VGISYTYDPVNRLTAADYDGGMYFHYTYDAVGNRLVEATNVLTNTYSYDDANRMIYFNSVNYTWDDNGNLLSDGVNSYSYDRANRLIEVSGVGVDVSYAYNGLGDRLSETANSQTTHYTMDLNAGLTQVLQDGTNTYQYGLDRIAQYSANGPEYYLADALGSVRQMVDANGNVTMGRMYKPYGGVLSSTGSGATSYGYTNEYTSQGLIYLRARFYSPSQGRFLTKDTWEGDYIKPMSYNAWLYGYANPARFTDPSGLEPLIKLKRDPMVLVKNFKEIKANTWNKQEEISAELAAYDVGKALAHTINSNVALLKKVNGLEFDDCYRPLLNSVSPTLAFLLVYKGSVTFMHKPISSGDGSGSYAQTQDRNMVWVFKDYKENYAVDHPGWIIHELGHAFQQALSPGAPWNSPTNNGLLGDLLKRSGGRDDLYAGFKGGFESWQYSRQTTPSEIYADMFLGWVYNEWASKKEGVFTPLGQRRADFMDQIMVKAIGISLDIGR